MKKIIVLLLILSSISSCALWQNRKTNIINKELILISKDDTKQKKLPFIIIKADGRLSGSTGCNRILGTAYFGDPGDVIFKNIATTKMFCEQNNDLEEKFLYILNNTLHYNITGDAVYLLDGNKQPLVKLKIK